MSEKQEKKFEEAMQRLEELVQNLENGELPLESALEAFEEGMQLIKFCSRKLEEAEKRVSLLVQNNAGEVTRAPFEQEPVQDAD
jgi:exodeoxyribonuclease VII small subunit